MTSVNASRNSGKPASVTASTPTTKLVHANDEEVRNPKTHDLSRKHILIVEDHESNILVTTLLLNEFGCTYDVAMNGFQAVDLYKDKKYDAVLMDVQMPQMSGLEATTIIRQMERDLEMRRTPIIALSAHVQPNDRTVAMESGMDDFLAKPFDSSSLRGKLQRNV